MHSVDNKYLSSNGMDHKNVRKASVTKIKAAIMLMLSLAAFLIQSILETSIGLLILYIKNGTNTQN